MIGIAIDREQKVPLKRQIYGTLKEQIMNGSLKEDEILPSTRELAGSLNVSRNTVCEAYDMLIAEGFIISSQGAPTRVAKGILLERLTSPDYTEQKAKTNKILFDFQTGKPDITKFPRYTFIQMLQSGAARLPDMQLGYTSSKGIRELREEIAAWNFRIRGFLVDPSDIFITAGATHGLHVVADILHKEEGQVLIEDPCHKGMLQTFINRKYNVVPVPVDEHGMNTQNLSAKNPCAVYVTPSHQFPLGGILPASRRAQLIRYAQKNKCYIIEDDYDSEFRYNGDPIAPMYAMDSQRVIYVGTFSKVMYPALRIGYVILPRELHKKWFQTRPYIDVQNPTFEQAALTEFLKTRKLDRHTQKMRRIYKERRSVLMQCLSHEFGDMYRVWGDAAGLHLSAQFKGIDFDSSFIRRCKDEGVRIALVTEHCIGEKHKDKILIGYGHLEPEQIKEGVKVLSSIIKSMYA